MTPSDEPKRLGFYDWAMILLVVGMAACAIFLVVRFLLDKGLDAQTFGDAGSFFGFAYGVPVTAAAALFAFLAGRIANRIQDRQGDLEILRFVEEKSGKTVRLQRRVYRALADSLEHGTFAREIGERLLAMLGEDREIPDSEMKVFLALLNELGADHTKQTLEAVLDKYSDDILRWASRRLASDPAAGQATRQNPDAAAVAYVTATLKGAVQVCQDLNSAIKEIRDAFQALSDDLITSMISRDQLRALDASRSPVGWLRSWLAGRLPAGDMPDDRDLAERLSWLADRTVARELLLSVAILPQDADELDLIGMILMRESFEDQEPNRLALEGSDVFFNLGAAYYLTAWLHTPSKASIIATFRDVFDHGFRERRRVAMRYLDRLLPELEDLRLDHLPKLFRLDQERLNRLIVVVPPRGGAMFYNPARQPAFWRTGGPGGPFLAVRRLFSRGTA